jgi:hypothetical protein
MRVYVLQHVPFEELGNIQPWLAQHKADVHYCRLYANDPLPDVNETDLLIVLGGHLVTVEFDGILPDLFREGQGIVAQGTLKDATTVAAFEVLAKHDENYMPPEVADATNGMHFKPEYTEAQLQGAKQ